ncbi:Formylglycine-generating enzyme, required for sulfatase activity, contains SUMF1/FGE domain [Hydrobacter penzbergensis]|uniref:Formylglycine-generating enzyme, required for sulfatase activity, contains SUMF1/FGE domain n=1 Tax=Hydrobacter penzbergensis TaxID=1235997 RepID=A0A8X8IDC5_9BACT|nr:formylglycine-generating enzyme family protein [Hydrobacter penzbergensis]SDW26141.1 Formylglycine-generating enzyme, required for sulfatase activity, contains SUMF1/FGE domain [Hydrobacter penzbergensis]
MLMKRCLLKSIFLLAACVMVMDAAAQLIKAPTNTKTGTDSKKKTGTKPQVKFRDDNEEKKEGAFAYLVLKASKSSAINVSINESEAGKIKAGMSKRVPLNNTDEMRISLSDGQGTQYDTSFVVQDKDAGRNIVIAFPEVDYTPVKDDQLHQEKLEELRRIKEAQEALKQQHIASLNEAEGRIRDWIKQIFNDKTALQTLIIKIRKGESGITDQVLKSRDLFLNDKNQLASLVKNYSDSAVAFTMKDERDRFLKEIKIDLDKITRDESYRFIDAVQAGKAPLSDNIEIALKASRSSDIGFFIRKDSLEEAIIGGKRIIDYALDVKSDTTVFRYLFEHGVGVNNYGGRFAENKEIYATPLAHACINADTDVIKLFIEKGARFFPATMSRIEKKKQLKVLLTKFGSRSEVMALLKANNYDVDDGTVALSSALQELDSSMVLVEGGQFTMGCTNEVGVSCSTREKPAIAVTVDSFYISKYELTQHIWAAIMEDDNPSFFKDCPNCPVEMISWKAANDFIERLNKLSNKKFRLPTEAEWEYAARGGKLEDKSYYYAGSRDANEVAWYKDNANKTSPVGGKKPNPLGLYDMSGNVSEWCSDYYAEDYFSHSTRVNPIGPELSAQKVLRGGSFMQSSWSSRISNREGHELDFSNNATGFRLAMSK